MGKIFGRDRAGTGLLAAIVIALRGGKLGAGLCDLGLGAVGAGIKAAHLAHGAGKIGLGCGQCDVGR